MAVRVFLLFLLLGSALAAEKIDAKMQATLLALFGTPPPQTTTDAPNDSCLTENNEAGVCVPSYLCDINSNTVVTDGAAVIDIRFGQECLHYLDVCCLDDNKRSTDNPVTPKPTEQEKTRQGCGWRNPKGKDMRTTGDIYGETKFGEFPWMVAIFMISQGTPFYIGGGSLIHRRIVLTAAHYVTKVEEVNSLTVRAGDWDVKTTKEIYPHQDIGVASVVSHKDFNTNNLYYDIALLFLDRPVDPAPHIGVACLPPPAQQAQDGTKCFATGWGKDKFNGGNYQVILKKIELPVIGHRACQDMFRKTRLGRRFQLHQTFMCAGGEAGIDTCTGDGGSPLVCPIESQPDRFVQNGIVAWGIGCGSANVPGAYVDVAVLRPWIDDQVQAKGIYDLEYAQY